MNALALLLLAACSTEAPAPEPAPAAEPPTKEEPAPAPAPEVVPVAGADKVNVNTATDAEFKAAIPEIGKKMLHEFEEYRPYKSISQFRKEMGKYVPAEKIAMYEEHLYVPVDFNNCDAATLQQIPGLDAAGAEALIGARPFADQAAFETALADKVGAEQVAVVKGWLVVP